MSTPEEIRAEKEAILERIRILNREIDVERAKLGVVQARCSHPSAYMKDTWGDRSRYCPDCGGP